VTLVIPAGDRGDYIALRRRATIKSMKARELDSGLLAVFRLFTAIRFVLAAVGVIMDLAGAGMRPGYHPLYSWINFIESSLLFVYLSFPWFRKVFGRWYIPLALVIATVGPIVAAWTLRNRQLPPDMNLAQVIGGQWQVMIVLLLPLILISWRYRFRVLFTYIITLALVDLVTVLVFYFPEQRLSALVIAVVVFRTMFYLLVGYAINRLVRELRQQNIDLEKANRRLSNFALVNEHLAVSRERNRLARELHDTLAHTLSGQAVQLEAVQTLWDLNPDQARTRLVQVLSQTRQGLKETRRAIQSLRASPVEDLGLAMALEQLLCSAGDRAGFEPILEMPEIPLDLPGELEHAIYRVAEEAIRNIEQHARASKVGMTLKNAQGSFEMEIIDDGVGFDPDSVSLEHRFGLLGMSERAAAVGGELHITSQLEQGTVVQLRLEV